jgi:phosphotransferase system enzyme I (PtsI)
MIRSGHPNSRPPYVDLEPPSQAGAVVCKGISASPGIAVGKALVLGQTESTYTRRHISALQVDGELERLRRAVEHSKTALREVGAHLIANTSDQAAIFDAYLLMLSDPLLLARVEEGIRTELKCAEWAVSQASEDIANLFLQGAPAQDAYVVERRHDVHFVCERILRALMGEPATLLPRLDEPTVVVARDLSPADTVAMVREPVVAFVTVVGSRTSHTAIMARALEIPAVVGAHNALFRVRDGDTVIVDGLRGEIVVNPSVTVLEDARARSERHLAFARELLAARDRPCRTVCGERIQLKANVELPAEAVLALDHGSEGIGLYRTEFLYIDRDSLPSEEEQYELYRAVVETTAPHPVVLRTFDIGGDKFASTFRLPAEMNPALGLRAIRLALSQPEIFKTQLRAMLRASAHGDLRILVPMVASVQDLRAVRALLAEVGHELDLEGHARAEHVPVGIMIEVPSAAMMADVLAREADFFSLGTNDLVQYSLAIDRTNHSLAHLASPFHPAIIRMAHTVCRAAAQENIPVSICGAMASDPLAAALLVGLGLRELSMEASAIPEIKEAISRVSVAECEAVAQGALAAESAEAVLDLVAKAFAPRFYDLLAEESQITFDSGTHRAAPSTGSPSSDSNAPASAPASEAHSKP